MAVQQTINSTTQKFLDIYDIDNNLVILKDGFVSFIISVSAMNFGLLAEQEQDAVIYTYAALLNSLNYPIQILIQSQTKDATRYLNLLKEQEKQASTENKALLIAGYRQFVSQLIKQRNVLDKKFYVIASATPLELGLMTAESFIPGKSEVNIENFDKNVILEKAQSILESRRDHLISQFARIGLFARQLETQEIIKNFYTNYNPEASEGLEIAESSQYSTAMVKANFSINPQQAQQMSQQLPYQAQQQDPAQQFNQQPQSQLPFQQPINYQQQVYMNTEPPNQSSQLPQQPSQLPQQSSQLPQQPSQTQNQNPVQIQQSLPESSEETSFQQPTYTQPTPIQSNQQIPVEQPSTDPVFTQPVQAPVEPISHEQNLTAKQPIPENAPDTTNYIEPVETIPQGIPAQNQEPTQTTAQPQPANTSQVPVENPNFNFSTQSQTMPAAESTPTVEPLQTPVPVQNVPLKENSLQEQTTTQNQNSSSSQPQIKPAAEIPQPAIQKRKPENDNASELNQQKQEKPTVENQNLQPISEIN